MSGRIATALALGLAALGGTGAALARSADTAVGTSLREYHVTLYRSAVPRGIVRFSMHNYGQDPHDLAVRRDGRTLARAQPLRAGETRVLRVRLTKPGRYVVLCTLPHHAQWGMRTVIRVR